MSDKAFAKQDMGGPSGFEAIVPGATQVVAIGSGSVQSTSVSKTTTIVRLFSTVDCFLTFGANPTATNSGYFLPGGIIDFVGVDGGSKIAAIQSSTTGNLYIAEGAG